MSRREQHNSLSENTIRFDQSPDLQAGGATPPLRPERSIRRPLNTPSPASPSQGRFSDGDTSARSSGGRGVGALMMGQPSSPEQQQSKSRRIADQLNISTASPSNLLAPSRNRRDSTSSTSSTSSSRGPNSPGPTPAPAPPTAALSSAIAAFSRAGARRDRRAEPAAAPTKRRPTTTTAYPSTPAFRQVESVILKVQSEWPALLHGTAEGEEHDFDPVQLALSLLNPDPSSGGNLPAFLRLKAELDQAIAGTLSGDSNAYRAFEVGVSGYNSALAGLGGGQKKVEELRKQIGEVRERLEGKGREGLAGMYGRMSHLEEMVKIMDEIDTLRSVPDRLETLLSEKRFLSAVVLLVRSLKTINKPEMLEIGALSDLRAWFVLQEGVLLEILIEELHNHLYLKSFYCDARWKAYTRGQTSLPHVDFGDDSELPSISLNSHPSSKLQRYLTSLSLRPLHNPLLDEPMDEAVDEDEQGADGQPPPQKHVEADSFGYIEGLLESLACLGKLGFALDAVAQRAQMEVFNLVEATVDEVDERNDSLRQGLGNRPPSSFLLTSGVAGNSSRAPLGRGSLASLSGLSLSRASTNRSSLLRLTATETSALETNLETLKDLFWTLYSKLDAVLQGFRVTYEVATRIAERRDFKDSSMAKSSSGALLFSLAEVWKPVQQEVRSLLHDYLTDDQSGTISSRNPIVSVNEVLRLAKPRDNVKQIFKFADSDLKASSKALKSHEDDLNRALRAAVPGLMTDGTSVTQLAVNSITSGGRSAAGGTHKALIQADAFNVSVLFGPTLAFLERVKEVMPGGMTGDDESGFGGFLDEFVLRTFLPQLEEKVSSVFRQAVGGHDAFQDDPNYKKVSAVSIVKSVTNLMLLINSLCSMLRSTPFHRENYSHLIVSVIHQFFERCSERFQDLTAGDSVGDDEATKKPLQLKKSATWAAMPQMFACLSELRETPSTDAARIRDIIQREARLEHDMKGNVAIATEDLISPSQKLLALGTLYSSLDWFLVQISALQIAPEPLSTGPVTFADLQASEDAHSPGGNLLDEATLSVALTREMAQPFEALRKSYRQLADTILFTLRLEVRLRTMHHLDKATRDGVYHLFEDTAEPDPSVVDLNSNLAEFDECAATTLAAPERRFIFEGLSLLMDHLLISNSRYIRLANTFGLSKMLRNILALQQNLKNIGDAPLEVNFERSRKFWEVFGKGPQEMLEAIRAGTISYEFEDYKSLLNLMCEIDQSAKDDPSSAGGESGGGGDRSRRMYNEYLIDLFALDVGE